MAYSRDAFSREKRERPERDRAMADGLTQTNKINKERDKRQEMDLWLMA